MAVGAVVACWVEGAVLGSVGASLARGALLGSAFDDSPVHDKYIYMVSHVDLSSPDFDDA